MSENTDRLLAQIKLLQGELEAEFAIRRAKLRYTLQGTRAVFEEEILRAHRELRVGLFTYIFNARLLTILTAPVIYYLNILEAINCAYCSYGNGLMAYAGEITARTERYWCPIKHARKAISSHQHYIGFADFGDGETFRKKYGHTDTPEAS